MAKCMVLGTSVKSLTSEEVRELNNSMKISLEKGDILLVPEGAQIFTTLLQTETGKEVEGTPFTLVVIRRADGRHEVTQVTLSTLWGSPHFVAESECALEPCKNKQGMYYAAEYRLHKAVTRKGVPALKEGQSILPALTFRSTERNIEGHWAPRFSQVWEKNDNAWVNTQAIVALAEEGKPLQLTPGSVPEWEAIGGSKLTALEARLLKAALARL